MAMVYQEFYCASSGGGCGGYITFPLNPAINGIIELVCPKCSHEHQRMIKNGILTDVGRYQNNPTQKICPNPAAWHKKPQHPDSRKRTGTYGERVSFVFGEDFLADRAFELWCGEAG